MFGGNLSFDHRTQDWRIFKSRLMQYCVANDITEDTDKSSARRRAILLTSLAEDTYRVASDLSFPTLLDVISYAELIDKLDKHFVSKTNVFAERSDFYKAEQRPGEDLAEWAARVRSLSQFCEFENLEVALRDKFVLGLENPKEKEILFGEDIKKLTLGKALELAQGVRCAHRAVAASLPPRTADVFSVRGSTNQGQKQAVQCAVCGYRNHVKEQCRFKNYTCSKCNQKGHLKKMCKSVVKRSNFLTVGNNDDLMQDLTE